ncbi:MAG: hypothetical protein FJ137_21735 [Deltaproteobacteria bacterium]|nr:hypothetical protein [Deltaproteobacteria bacterium]
MVTSQPVDSVVVDVDLVPGVSMRLPSSVVAVLLLASLAHAGDKPPDKGYAAPPTVTAVDGGGAMDEPRKVAEAYLKALSGKGDDSARNYLLGGVTLTANDFSIPNWKLKKRDAPRIEDKDVGGAVKMLGELEQKGAELLNAVVVSGEDSSVHLSQAKADKLMEPTKSQAQKFIDAYPTFAYVARVGRPVFWHPDNPFLKEVKKLPKGGHYHLEVHRFQIEETDNSKSSRVWPLRVLRLTSTGYDSGWKILPASDWDPNY